MPSALEGTLPGRFQGAWTGSFGRAGGFALDPAGGLALAATIWPTAPGRGRQGVVTLDTGAGHMMLGIGPGGGAMAELLMADGTMFRAEVNGAMLERCWYDVALSLSADGTLRVRQQPRGGLARRGDAGAAASVGRGPLSARKVDIFLAACGPDGARPASAHFNGKLERPTIWRGAGIDDAIRCQSAPPPHPDVENLLACWDFARGIAGSIATDIGPNGAHARLHNLPTRAMTGALWTGAVHDWTHAPEQYAAIHFHDDDQGDLGWSESFALDVPDTWPSGFYSAHIRNEGGEDYVPFFVRPRTPRSDVVLLVPTYTYQVYGNFLRPGRGAEIAERAGAWGALRETPDMNPQFGLSAYNYHSDGSGVAITSMARPMLDTRPRQISLMDPAPNGSGTGRINADSYIVDWLDRLGVDCDVVTDHDLHAEGVDALAPYRVVIAAQHPEYHSERMMIALERYLGGGGRLMYLGGNGFYWRAEPSAAEPHALEIRRAEGGIRVWPTEAGENYHQFGGGLGGLWRRIGRPAHRLVGSGFSSQGRHSGFPYHFTDAIRDPRVAFVTEGLTVAPGDALGDAGFMGGGAAGFELDSADPRYGTPVHTLVVAKGIVVHPDYGPVNEDMLVIRHPRPVEDWSCADMLFFETPAGGAVFSVGSMTFVGSLPVDNYTNTLARLTGNVLRRFRDETPFV